MRLPGSPLTPLPGLKKPKMNDSGSQNAVFEIAKMVYFGSEDGRAMVAPIARLGL
nr:hypothetical protein [Pseudomonas syringae pv. actinidiae]